MKPWNLSPLEWRDLQCWWGLVFNLINYSGKDLYKWNDKQMEVIASFFDLSKVNELPLNLLINDIDIDNNEKKELRSKVTCFWCYELAKREGLDPIELIKNGNYKPIEWIFHCPIDPLSGKLCCPKLKQNGLKN